MVLYTKNNMKRVAAAQEEQEVAERILVDKFDDSCNSRFHMYQSSSSILVQQNAQNVAAAPQLSQGEQQVRQGR